MNTATHEAAPRKRKPKAANPEFKQVFVEELKGDLAAYSRVDWYKENLGATVVPGYEDKTVKLMEYPYAKYEAMQADNEKRGNDLVKPRKASGHGFTDEFKYQPEGLTVADLAGITPQASDLEINDLSDELNG